MRYLFTEEGAVTIPAKTIYWFHPYREKLYKKTLPEINLKVVPNPNLGMVKTMQDSLNAQSATEIVGTETDKQPFRVMGLTLTQFITAVVIALFVIWLMVKLLVKLTRYLTNKREQYRGSELYYFRQFKKALHSNQVSTIENALYKWLDQLSIKEPSIYGLAEKTGMKELENEARKLHQGMKTHQLSVELDASIWSKAREAYYQHQKDLPTDGWINP
jgi:hypothetical protein